MIRLLLFLYPKSWRATYGDEYAALLEETRLTPRALLDVVAQAVRLRASTGGTAPLVALALVWSAVVEIVAVRAGLTDNVLWVPRTPLQALALLGLLAPWVALAARRRGPHRHARPAPR
jgi:hypothetical protein